MANEFQAENVAFQQWEDLLRRAIEVFGTAEKASSWLTTPNAGFRGLTPRDAAATVTGRQQVNSILVDLEHGFPA